MKIEREQHVTDGGTTWTISHIWRGRRLQIEWYGPTHAYHPDTPDYHRRGWEDVDDAAE